MKLIRGLYQWERQQKLKKTGKERGKHPAFSRMFRNLNCSITTTVLDREREYCYSGPGGALPFKERRRATIIPGLTRHQKGTPLHANWIDNICRDASQSSAGARNVWGFGKGFETSTHPADK